MVNRAGRSKGCITCRRRRVKCDEAKPFCSKCAQVGYVCDGYEQINFIDERAQAVKKVERQSRKHNRDHAIPKLPDLSLSSSAGKPKQLAFLPPAVAYNIGLEGFRHEIFTSFAMKHIPSALDSQGHWPRLTSTTCELYSPLAVAYDNSQGVSGACFDALASSFFATTHNDPDSREIGSRQYVLALRKLNTALSSPGTPSDDLIAAISLMMVYESLVTTHPQGWIHHSVGLSRLMTFWGPQAFQGRASLRLFIETRNQIILANIVRRKRCFLESEEWKLVPFEKMPELKSSLQLVLDHYVHVPGLLEQRDIAMAHTDEHLQREQLFVVREAIYQRIHVLQSWYDDWRQSYPEDVKWQVGDEYQPLVADELAFVLETEHNLWFNGGCAGRSFINYHCIRILLHWLLLSSYPTPSLVPDDDYPWADRTCPISPQWNLEIDKSVHAILAGIPYFCGPESSSHFFLLGPVRTIYAAALGQTKEKCRQLLLMLSGFSNLHANTQDAWTLAEWLSNKNCGRRSERERMSMTPEPRTEET